jgi:hypothetical protein
VIDQSSGIGLDLLLKLRVVVARIGEMDRARWWNTTGQLGPLGSAAVSRGLPRTHYFAQARSVFAVAGDRCDQVFNPPGSVTLWRLPEATEEQFDARWEHWLDNAGAWDVFFQAVAQLDTTDLAAALRSFDFVNATDVAAVEGLSVSAEGRAVPLPGWYNGTTEDVTLLALGFARGRPGFLAVPYARRGEV